MELFVSIMLFLVMCGVAIRAEYSGNRCIPGSDAFICTLTSFHYDPDESIPQFHLPKGVKSVRFVMPYYYTSFFTSCIPLYDAWLHRQLNSPVAIEIVESCVETIDMPPNLEYADFASNRIRSINASSDQSYALRYLNLNHNYRLEESTVVNISHFVNLETLYMSFCHLESVPSGLFDKLNRLTRLFLAANELTHLDMALMPPSLNVLHLEHNGIKTVILPKGHFPVLERLNVEDNELKDVNIGELLVMAPKLKLFALGHNGIKRDRLSIMLDELVRRNVAYYNTEVPEDSECLSDERNYRGACIPESSFPLETGDWVEIILLVILAVTVCAGAVFGGMKLWAKYPPSWELVNYFKRER